jgi:hypothetical protein
MNEPLKLRAPASVGQNIDATTASARKGGEQWKICPLGPCGLSRLPLGSAQAAALKKLNLDRITAFKLTGDTAGTIILAQ